MKTVTTIEGMREALRDSRGQCRTIGFVPTMGYLHRGHMTLVEQSKKENDLTVVSIFVNPSQFGPNEDFSVYPRDLERDEALLRGAGVDLVFYPDSATMYPPGYATYVEVETMGGVLCGKSRPTHFRGVTTVVLKLFNIVCPTRAYFGRKDAQQAIVLKKMVRDLDLDLVIETVPIVRDDDGLALSSRNVYLSPEQRKEALRLPRALQRAKTEIMNGGCVTSAAVEDMIRGELDKGNGVTIDYVEAVSLDGLEKKPDIDVNNTLVAVAIRVGKTRLIDNFILGEI